MTAFILVCFCSFFELQLVSMGITVMKEIMLKVEIIIMVLPLRSREYKNKRSQLMLQ